MRALALAICVLLVPAVVSADIDEKGIRIGLGTFPVNQNQGTPDTTPSPRPGPSSVSLGSYITLRASSSFALQLETVLAEKGSQSELCHGTTGGDATCVDTSDLDAYYLELPVLLRFDLLPGQRSKFHLDLGGELAIHLGSVDHIPSERVVNFKSGNIGGVAGVGYEFGAGPGRITFDVRLIRWAAPLKDADLAHNMSKIDSGNQFSFLVGYAFP